MIAAWTDKYIGIPFKHNGRTIEGCDCWGLVRLILKEQFSINVNSFAGNYEEDNDDYARIIDTGIPLVDAKEIIEPEIGDIVLMRICGRPCHVGMYVGDSMMLHTLSSFDSALDHTDGLRWKTRIGGYFRVR